MKLLQGRGAAAIDGDAECDEAGEGRVGVIQSCPTTTGEHTKINDTDGTEGVRVLGGTGNYPPSNATDLVANRLQLFILPVMEKSWSTKMNRLLLFCLVGALPPIQATTLRERLFLEPFAGVIFLTGDSLSAALHTPASVDTSSPAFGTTLGVKLNESFAFETTCVKSGTASQSLSVSPPPTGPSTNPAPTSGDFSFRSLEWRIGVAAKQTIVAQWKCRGGFGVAFRTIKVANSDYQFSDLRPVPTPVVPGTAPVTATQIPSVWRSFENTTYYARVGLIRSFGEHLSVTFDYSYSGRVQVAVPYTYAYKFPAAKIAANGLFLGVYLEL